MKNRFDRRKQARQIRIDAAASGFHAPHPEQSGNGDEIRYGSRNYFANYSKGLPHDANGEVTPSAYERLLKATQTGLNADFEAIPLGFTNGRKLTSPQAGHAFDLEGADAQQLAMPPAPAFNSAEAAAEMVELYWMALARDVHFSNYAADPIIGNAVADMNNLSDYRGQGPAAGRVNAGNIFRSFRPGNTSGPYISQFLLRDIPYGTLCIKQQQKTAVGNRDYLTVFAEWLDAQKGKPLALNYNPCANLPSDAGTFDTTRRYIRNLRDLATYVHYDALYEAYLNACLILLGLGAPVDKGNPYVTATKQDGFATFGGPHILSLVCEVATRALKAVWHQKWNVNRRLRPEAFGGRVHLHKTAVRTYPIHSDLLNSSVLLATSTKFGTCLLPQAFAEGSPTHPAYGAGHATVAGACVTVLKAWFDESFVLTNPVQASADGLSLVPWVGEPLTVGGELNKVAANVGIGRNAGGVHYFSDYRDSLELGEAIAISILREQKSTYSEEHYFTLQKFDGTSIVI